MTDDIGLREWKKRETRYALSRAAIKLCVERGWDAVTVDDIAAEAKVSPRTFRNYFASKAEAIAAAHLERALRIGDALRARPAGEPLWDAVTHAVAAQYTVDYPDDRTEPPATLDLPAARQWRDGIWGLFAVPAVESELRKADAAVQEELAVVVAERLGVDIDVDVYPRLLAAVVSAASAAAVGHWMRTGPVGPVDPVLRDAFDRVKAGLPVPD